MKNEKINTSQVRGGALLTFLILLLAIIFAALDWKEAFGLTMAYQVVSFYTSAWGKPLGLNKRIGTIFAPLFGIGEYESTLPIKFSAKIGFFLTSIALVSMGNINISLMFTACCFVASALNAFSGFCIACKIYPRYILLKSKF